MCVCGWGFWFGNNMRSTFVHLVCPKNTKQHTNVAPRLLEVEHQLEHHQQKQNIKEVDQDKELPTPRSKCRVLSYRSSSLSSMAIVSTSSLLHQYSSFPKCPNFSHYSRFRPRLHFSSLRLSSSAIRATASVAVEPVNTQSLPLSLPSITHAQVFVFMFLFFYSFLIGLGSK